MLYDNAYNRNLSRQLHEIAQRRINHAKVIGGAILGGVIHELSESDTDDDYKEGIEGGNGFAAGTHLDTGFGPTLGASPVDKITKEAVLHEAKMAQGGAQHNVNSGHQTLMGGPQMGMGNRKVEAKGFWDDFATGFKQGFNGVMDVATPLLPLAGLLAGKKEKKKRGGAKQWHELKDKNELPSSSMGGAKRKKPILNAKQDLSKVIAEANPAFDLTEIGNQAGVEGNTHGSAKLSYAHGAGIFDKVKAALRYLKDYAIKKAKNLEPSDFLDLSKERIFLKIARELVNELPDFIDAVKGGAKRAALRRHLKTTDEGRGLLDTVGPLLKFAPLLLGLGKHKGKVGKGFLSGLLSEFGLGKRKRKGKGMPALDKGTNEELADLPKAQAEGKGILSDVLGAIGLGKKKAKKEKKGKGILKDIGHLAESAVLDSIGLGKKKGKGKKELLLPQQVLTQKKEGKGILSDVLGAIGLGKKKGGKMKDNIEVGGKRKASAWAMLVKKVMAEQKMAKMADAIAYIKKHNLYKKNQ